MIDEFKRIGSENANIEDILKNFSNVDKTVIEVAKNIKTGKNIINDLDEAMKNTATTSAQFTSSLKSAAVNIGIMLLANLAIKAVTAIWDQVNVTMEETKERLDELASSLQNMKSKYSLLSIKDPNALSQSEKRGSNT